MGMNCKITLPAACRLRDVADVIGALAGLPVQRQYFETCPGWITRVEGVECSSYAQLGLEGCAKIQYQNPMDGLDHQIMYHFEWGKDGSRGLMPSSTPFWIAIGRGLVDFFGGSVDYNDCDDSDVDYQKPEQPDIHAEDDEEWYSLQERKLAVKRITKAEIKELAKVARYGAIR